MANGPVFNSASCPEGKIIDLACGYISLTEIAFENEKIIVSIEAKKGKVVFCDLDAKELLSAEVELPSGDEKFSEVKCIVEGEIIKLGFPRYTYKDNYPNCDGESDRWTKSIVGFDFLCYDFKNNCII